MSARRRRADGGAQREGRRWCGWISGRSTLNRRYLLKHTSHTVPAFVSSIDYRMDLSALTHEPAQTLHMNDIGAVSLHLLRPIAVDLYRDNRSHRAR